MLDYLKAAWNAWLDRRYIGAGWFDYDAGSKFMMRRRVIGGWEYRDCTPEESNRQFYDWAMRP
jgi:hypothetical protein